MAAVDHSWGGVSSSRLLVYVHTCVTSFPSPHLRTGNEVKQESRERRGGKDQRQGGGGGGEGGEVRGGYCCSNKQGVRGQIIKSVRLLATSSKPQGAHQCGRSGVRPRLISSQQRLRRGDANQRVTRKRGRKRPGGEAGEEGGVNRSVCV